MELLHLLNLFLICALLLLILTNIYNYFNCKLREGATTMEQSEAALTYKPYDELEKTDPMFLAIKNAANISYIKTQLDDLQGIKQQIFDLSNNVYSTSQQIDEIQTAIEDQTEAITGGAIQNEDEENMASQEIIPENEEEFDIDPIETSETAATAASVPASGQQEDI